MKNRKLAVWKFIKDSLNAQVPVILLYVVHSRGSSPGRRGFSMAVNFKGRMEGSIGGGIMEHKLVEQARQILLKNEVVTVLKRQVHDKEEAKDQSGMICSGEQTICICRIKERDIEIVEQIITAIELEQQGELQLSPQGLFYMENLSATRDGFTFSSDDIWTYSERIGCNNHLYIIGGGHCSLAFSRLMASMDFIIHLYENRNELNTFLENNYVHHKIVVEDYNLLNQLSLKGQQNYLVVMTFGYRTDDIAVRALMKKSFSYFGILGSKAKIDKMFAQYRKDGIEEEWLKRIHAPIGLDIKSETPEEIAVSIAAEIIKVKNGR